jgi:putative spermidine/putrescine transport system permease protein
MILPTLAVVLAGIGLPLFFLILSLVTGTDPSGPEGVLTSIHRLASARTLTVALVTLQTAVAATVGTLVLGFPLAYYLYSRPHPVRRSLVILALFTPLFISVVARSYAWVIIFLPRSGLVASIPLLRAVPILFTETAVIIAMVHVLLPFMVLAIYGSLAQVSPNLLNAAASLGASERQITMRVTIPLAVPGMIAGSSIVFVLASTSIAIPVFLGGISGQTMAYAVWQQYLIYGNFTYGTVLALVLVGAVLLVMIALRSFEARVVLPRVR